MDIIMKKKPQPFCPIIVALDVDTKTEALRLVKQLGSHVDIFKVGLQLFSREGFSVVDAIISKDKRVFVDLKLHDIPNTVANATRALAVPGVEFLTIHAAGGEEMLRAAVRTLQNGRSKNPSLSTRLLAVTVLTSLDDTDLRQIGVGHSVAGQALNLARLAVSAGVDGVVASPHEVRLIRAELGRDLILVTPGVRLETDNAQDQKRVMTPTMAMKEGSNFLVMGRSLLGASDPLQMIEKVLAGFLRR